MHAITNKEIVYNIIKYISFTIYMIISTYTLTIYIY
jgi:hypothetical protein